MTREDAQYLHSLFWACLEREYFETASGGSFDWILDGRLLYIFFEKSDGAEDWLNNLDFFSQPYGEMAEPWYCHGGFLRVWKEILPYLKEILANGELSCVVTVGYSHGAALALLCHEYLWFHRPDLRGRIFGYGFGCPRVVRGYVPRESERWRNFYVIRNIDDAVTHLPPSIFGFRHVGQLVEIGEAGKYTPIDAHRAENYLYELEKFIYDKKREEH